MADVEIKSYRKEREAEIVGRLQSAMEKVGALVEREAKINATNPIGGGKRPWVRSGLLSSNIGHTTKTEGNEITALIGFSKEIPAQEDVQYARSVELGTPTHPPYPFLFPALESNQGKIIDILKKSGAKGVSITLV